MAMLVRRAGIVSNVVSTMLMRGGSHPRYLATATAVHQEDDTFSSKQALAAFSALLGATALFSTCQRAISSEPAVSEEAGKTEKTALNPKEWLKFKLQETHDVNHNTKLFRFSFDPVGTGPPCGFLLAYKVRFSLKSGPRTMEVQTVSSARKLQPLPFYEPNTEQLHPNLSPDSKGYFDLMIKVYPQGQMSQHIAHLSPGDFLEVKGPIPKLPYEPNMKKTIGMIAGGTGITPMLQVVDAIMSNPSDNTQVSLVFANMTPEDILLKEKLDALQLAHPNFKVFYVVDKPTEDWTGGKGHVNKDVLLKGLPSPSEDTLILVCGPPGLMNVVSGDKAKDKSQGELVGLLKELGYTAEQVYKF